MFRQKRTQNAHKKNTGIEDTSAAAFGITDLAIGRTTVPRQILKTVLLQCTSVLLNGQSSRRVKPSSTSPS